jgi:cytochrome c oxidase cbb3-type subunit 1
MRWHFYIATLGIVFYITSMWVSGIMQGLMWRAYDSLGFLEYSFVETMEAMHPYYVIRMIGGLLYTAGGAMMAYNVWRTIRGDGAAEPVSSRPGQAPAAAS